MSYQDPTWNNNPCVQVSRRCNCRCGLSSDSRKLYRYVRYLILHVLMSVVLTRVPPSSIWNSQKSNRDQSLSSWNYGWRCSRLSILGNVPRYSLSIARVAQQRADISISREQVSEQSGVWIQRHGSQYGHYDLRMG